MSITSSDVCFSTHLTQEPKPAQKPKEKRFHLATRNSELKSEVTNPTKAAVNEDELLRKKADGTFGNFLNMARFGQ